MKLERARKLLPVSRIRVVLEKIRILDDHEPWFKGRGDFAFTARVGFNHDQCRRHLVHIPADGVAKISDTPGQNDWVVDTCIYDGLVAENDAMTLNISAVEKDTFDPDDVLAGFERQFAAPPEAWPGAYRPLDQAPASDAEAMKDWMVWYRVESIPI